MMTEDMNDLHDLLIKKKGILYLCGSESMGKAVLNVIEDIFK